MKHIRVTVTEDYLLPDDWEITQAPNEEYSCLRGDKKYFLPDLQWFEYGLDTLTGKFKTEPHESWTAVSGEREGFFMRQMQVTGAEFCEIK